MINIKLFWVKNGNFGDELSPYIISKLCECTIIYTDTRNYNKLYLLLSVIYRIFKGKKIEWYRFNSGIKKNVLLSTGSVLNCANKYSIIWGSGIIKKGDKIPKCNYFAVRGYITYSKIRKIDINKHIAIGDPAILLPLLYKKNNIIKNNKIGIIPHLRDYNEIKKLYKNEYLIINLNDNIECVINNICSCEYIFSSSLHGLIVSHAYQIPALWFKNNNIGGDDVKFEDYFSSVFIEKYIPLKIKNENIEELVNIHKINFKYSLPKRNILSIQLDLIETFPYKDFITYEIINNIRNRNEND